jgi:hypothetical protein
MLASPEVAERIEQLVEITNGLRRQLQIAHLWWGRQKAPRVSDVRTVTDARRSNKP